MNGSCSLVGEITRFNPWSTWVWQEGSEVSSVTLGQSAQPEAGCFFCFKEKDGFSKSFGECSSIVI